MATFYNHVKRIGSTPFETVLNYLELIDNATSILDAGCGAGAIWDQTQNLKHIHSLFLCDQSPSLVECACKKARSAGVNIINGIVADLDAISSIIDINVDVVLSLQVYHHLHDVTSSHNHLRSLLCKDGVLIATTCCQDHMYELYELTAEFFGVDYEEARGLNHFNETHLLKLEGLFESKDIVSRIQCSSPDLFINYVFSLAILERFGIREAENSTDFIAYVENWAKKQLSDSGTIELHQSVKLAMFTHNKANSHG